MITPSFPTLVGLCIFLSLLQLAAAMPWLMAIEIRTRRLFRQWSFWAVALLVCAGAGLAGGFMLDSNGDAGVLSNVGRVYMSVLHLQLGADLFVVIFGILLAVWPKGGAVALSAFREAIRQPMFWFLCGGSALAMGISLFLPYFTFGEDNKMIAELCYAITMLGAAVFAVLEASISVSDEIEGKTAVTLMSKPVSRRQFLLGKFGGITLSALFMTILLGWLLIWFLQFGEWYTRMPAMPVQNVEPPWAGQIARQLFPASTAAEVVRGMALWCGEVTATLPLLSIGFCQVMVLVAIAVALATRVPMVVNLIVCGVVYFLGHLTPIMTAVTEQQYRLIYFVAQLFDLLLPGLDLFDVGPAIVREVPLPPAEYTWYTLNVAFYAIIYTAVALLAGLILFEDRDLA
jgi:ABC-type transport system involved in multi-copper enzyme maturation permease subunit